MMKHLIHKIGLGIIAICLVSCTVDELSEFSSKDSQLSQSYTDETKQLLPFAKALCGAMKKSPELRELIKNKSLQQFNKEYEVLYQFIKDERVEQ